jgi:HlyD family secretion protein
VIEGSFRPRPVLAPARPVRPRPRPQPPPRPASRPAAGLAAFLGVALVAFLVTVLALVQGRRASRALAPDLSGRLAMAWGGRVAAEGRVAAYPGAEVKVAAERAGRLLRVLVREGQRVRKGELLAEIDALEPRALLAQARARVAEYAAERRLAEINLRRRLQLVTERIGALSDLDQARRDVEIARARQQTAEAEAARQQAQLVRARVASPLSGTVISRFVEAGETVEAGAPVVTVADLSRLRIEGEAAEADAGALAEGSTVAITAEGYPGRSWRGRVEEVAQAVRLRRLKSPDPSRPTDTRVVGVTVVPLEAMPLKLGTTVTLEIDAGRHQGGH